MGKIAEAQIVGSLSPDGDVRAAARDAMTAALATFKRGRPILVVSHFDADGLTAAAILIRALRQAGREAVSVVVGKGESPWDPEVTHRLGALDPGGLIVADLGLGDHAVAPGCPTVIVDHHVPTGDGGGAIVISRQRPRARAHLVAPGLVGRRRLGGPGRPPVARGAGPDRRHGRGQGFPRDGRGAGALGQDGAARTPPRSSTSRAGRASGDAAPALALLLRCDGPKAMLPGEHARDGAARSPPRPRSRPRWPRRASAPRPRFAGDVALIAIDTPCQVHPLIAQQWRTRLKGEDRDRRQPRLRPGWVHFSARTSGRARPDRLPRRRTARRERRRAVRQRPPRRRPAGRCAPTTGTGSSARWASPAEAQA